jgi:hypothetical protein
MQPLHAMRLQGLDDAVEDEADADRRNEEADDPGRRVDSERPQPFCSTFRR